LALLVKAAMRTSDFVVRYGGEEFVVILPMTELAGCKVFAERLRRRVEDMKIVFGNIMIRITISIGVTTCEAEMVSINKSQMITAADTALYRAKQNGRNCVCMIELEG
ncbi:MAG: GGDEF domain-containing protein, partial [Desulfocapsaceae bacterium]|nr:GGDEF domain-containing protein [Desulfocapsaceae bacterium]